MDDHQQNKIQYKIIGFVHPFYDKYLKSVLLPIHFLDFYFSLVFQSLTATLFWKVPGILVLALTTASSVPLSLEYKTTNQHFNINLIENCTTIMLMARIDFYHSSPVYCWWLEINVVNQLYLQSS